MRLVQLGDDWPVLPTCSQCAAEIGPGQHYAVPPGTIRVLCATCAALPLPTADPTPQRPRPTQDPPPGTPLPAGRWSLKYERCLECGTTEERHAGRGLCQRCYQRDDQRRRRERQRAGDAVKAQTSGSSHQIDESRQEEDVAAKAQTVPDPAQTSEHPSGCGCFGCADRRQQADARTVAVDWRGVPFAEAVAERQAS